MSNQDKKITELTEKSTFNGNEQGYLVEWANDHWFSFGALKNWLSGFFAWKNDVYTKTQSDWKYLTINGGNAKLDKNGGLREWMATNAMVYFDANWKEKTLVLQEWKIPTLEGWVIKNVAQSVDYQVLNETTSLSNTSEFVVDWNKKITLSNLRKWVFASRLTSITWRAFCNPNSPWVYSTPEYIDYWNLSYSIAHSADRNGYQVSWKIQISKDGTNWTDLIHYATSTVESKSWFLGFYSHVYIRCYAIWSSYGSMDTRFSLLK